MGVLEILKLAVTHPDELRVSLRLGPSALWLTFACKAVVNRQLWFDPKVLEDDDAYIERSTRLGSCTDTVGPADLRGPGNLL